MGMSGCRSADAEWPPSSPLSDRASTAPNGLFNGLIWPKAGCASIAYDATAASNFLPLPARLLHPHLVLRLGRAAHLQPRLLRALSLRSQARW